MGRFINVGNENFKEVFNGPYIDKTALISYINSTLETSNRYTCVTRCRRFGKSMAADMLCAYYDKSCDSRALFHGLEIENDLSFEKHLNKYPVIYISITDFISRLGHDKAIVSRMQNEILKELKEVYPDVSSCESSDLITFLQKVSETKREKFIMIIDEWDAFTREFDDKEGVMREYVNLLRSLFKNINTRKVFAGAYMTGILPIPKDNTQSTLNNFIEYSMTDPGRLSSFYGFTSDEVKRLCQQGGMDYMEMKKWYDGYQIGEQTSMFNPHSIRVALTKGYCKNNWGLTGAFEAVTDYIVSNFDGLKDAIINMVAAGRSKVDTGSFGNDPKVIKSKDDVLTLLIHLGYLAYDPAEGVCYIPNLEVRQEMIRAIKESKWTEVTQAIEASDKLLEAIYNEDEEQVALGIQKVHQRGTSILQYNDENSLACVLSLAFYSAMDYYVIHRELASGKGYADLVFIPRQNIDRPAIVMELKYNKDSKSALQQIKEHDYIDLLNQYTNNIILVGINYDPISKFHTCNIERVKPLLT